MMWSEDTRYEQPNVLDVTIQCQFNVAARNTDVRASFPECQRSVRQGNWCYSNTTPQRRYGYPDNFVYPTDSNAKYGFNASSDVASGNSDCAVNSSFLEDSGYGSPISGFSQSKSNSVFTPRVQSVHDTLLRDFVSVQSDSNSEYTLCDHANQTYQVQQVARTSQFSMPEVYSEEMKLAMREKDIMQRLFSLRTLDNDGVHTVEKYYQTQTSAIDQERHNVLSQMTLHDRRNSGAVQKYYNQKLMSLLECVEGKLVSLETILQNRGKKNDRGEKKSRMLPKAAVKLMEAWYQGNLENPYPSRESTLSMASEGGITVEQIRKWFANKRNRSRNDKLKATDAVTDKCWELIIAHVCQMLNFCLKMQEIHWNLNFIDIYILHDVFKRHLLREVVY